MQWEQFCAVEITPGQVVAIGGSKDYYDYETNRVRRKKNIFIKTIPETNSNCIFFRIQVELYDVETGFVRELPSMGRNRSYHACGVAQSKVLIFFQKKFQLLSPSRQHTNSYFEYFYKLCRTEAWTSWWWAEKSWTTGTSR